MPSLHFFGTFLFRVESMRGIRIGTGSDVRKPLDEKYEVTIGASHSSHHFVAHSAGGISMAPRRVLVQGRCKVVMKVG